MSDAAAQLIKAFSTLSNEEQHTVLIELARLSESDTPVSDQELSRAGEDIFAMYDQEEASLGDSTEG